MDREPPPHSPPDNPNPQIDIELDFQGLNLSHKEEIQVDLEEQSQEFIPTPFNLLFKVGPPDKPPSRNISLLMFEKAMRAAWGRRFYRASQIVPNLFMAHFREEDDLRWIFQRQPWTVERETMLVEWIDPQGGRPMDSFTFRYLPVTIHLYGIPKSLRTRGLVNKIIEKIGTKDESVAFTETIMFKPQDFVLARVILDVRKPLLDSVSVNISQNKKIKVYVYYEKLIKVCNFCGCLFHSVNSCLQRHQILWKLSPSEAAKVPQDVYGKWRTQEMDIPSEAREEHDYKSQNSYIQSFRDYFQKHISSPGSSSGSITTPETSVARTVNWHSMKSDDLQVVTVNAQLQRGSENIECYPESTGQESPGRNGRENEAGSERSSLSSWNVQMGQRQLVHQGPVNQCSMKPTAIFDYQNQQYQAQAWQWQHQTPFQENHQWQQQENPFVLNLQDHCSAGTSVQFQVPSSLTTAGALNLNQGTLQFPQRSKPYKKSRSPLNPNRNNFQSNLNPSFKRRGAPLMQPPSKKPTSPPFPLQPKSPTLPPSSSPPTAAHEFSPKDTQLEQSSRSRRRHGGQPSRWDRDAVDRDDGNLLQQVVLHVDRAQDEGISSNPHLDPAATGTHSISFARHNDPAPSQMLQQEGQLCHAQADSSIAVHNSGKRSNPQTMDFSSDASAAGGAKSLPIQTTDPDVAVDNSDFEGRLALALKAPRAS